MEIQVMKFNENKPAKAIKIAETVFGQEFNEPLVHQVVMAVLAGRRAGTHAQKTRAEVRGGGTKPWRQKGTGRARAGTIRSPLWRKGGIIFAAKPRDYSVKVNKKMYQGAMRSILSELIRQDRLVVAEPFECASPKTRELASQLKKMGIEKVLIVMDEINENLYLAARNIPYVYLRKVDEVNPVDLISSDKVLFTLPALKKFEERLQ